MAKRFITTDIFQDSWFMDLPSKYKLFWIYLITSCDYTGIWQVNFKLANFYVGDHLEPIECERILKDRIIKISEGKYWFIPKFIEFQYGSFLNEKNSTVKNVVNRLTELNLIHIFKNVEFITPSGDLRKDKDKDKDKDKVKIKVKDKEEEKLDFSFLENSPFKESFLNWIDYKGKKTYKNQKTLLIAFEHLKQMANNNPKTAAAIVNQSIANNWKGLFELKNHNQITESQKIVNGRFIASPENMRKMDYSITEF